MVQGAPTMTDTSYSPNPVEVKIGELVKWINQDASPHTATSDHAREAKSSIAPDVLSEGQTFSIIFEQPGTTHTSAYYIQIW
jgi:plastocyanin